MVTGMQRAVAKLTAPLRSRIANMLARGIVRLVSSGAGMQHLQVDLMAGETRDGAEHFESYGFTSRPHPGAECFVAFPFGSRDHPIVLVAADRRYRLKGLGAGEVALYDDLGQKIVLHRDRVELSSPGRVVVQAPAVDVVAGAVDVQAQTVKIAGDDVTLGGEGGAALARVGDMVEIGAGSSAGQWPIVSGSNKVSAA